MHMHKVAWPVDQAVSLISPKRSLWSPDNVNPSSNAPTSSSPHVRPPVARNGPAVRCSVSLAET